MRIQTRLSNEVNKKLEEYEKIKFLNHGKIMRGYAIGAAYDEIKPVIEKIDWERIYFEILQGEKSSSEKLYIQTTINFRQNVIDGIDKLIRDLPAQLGMEKVSRTVVINLVITAALKQLKNELQLIDLSEELVVGNKMVEYFLKKIGYDVKKYHYFINDNMKRIMCFFKDDIIQDLEKKGQTNDVDYLYELLGWKKYDSFDVIHSFWYIFSYGLHMIDADYYYITDKKNIRNVYKKPYNDPQGRYSYESYPEKYCSKSDSDKVIKLKLKNIELVKQFSEINIFAEITHTVQNFMPVPDEQFNMVKGLKAYDFLPLMIDLIEQCLEKKEELVYYQDRLKKTISITQLDTWKKFLKENREKLALDEEYYYNASIDRLVGISLFSNQSLEYPLPIHMDEYRTCINNVIERMKKRGKKLAIFCLGKN